MNKLLLEGKTAIVSGASYGMGKEMARVLAMEGAKVLMTARGVQRLEEAAEDIRKEGGNVLTMETNVSDPDDCRKVFAYAIEKFGQVDVLVNNAAMGEMWTVEAMTDEMIDKVVDTNLKGMLYYCREAVNHMLPRGTGSIINISSVNGVRPMCGCAYSSTKGGVNTLTESVAIRVVGTGVRCNAVAPGFTYTPASAGHEVGPTTLEAGKMNDIRNARTVRDVPTYPIDQANAVLFFASEMSRCVNGQILVVDNGSYL